MLNITITDKQTETECTDVKDQQKRCTFTTENTLLVIKSGETKVR